jgi:hypothetical protein
MLINLDVDQIGSAADRTVFDFRGQPVGFRHQNTPE